MSPLRSFTLLVLLGMMVGSPAARAQTQLAGTVVEAGTGAPLPAATVQVAGTYMGTITNADGAFSLRVDSLPAVLVVRYIGYHTARVPVDEVPATPLPIALDAVALEMAEIVVTGEDPAVDIMRKVIEHKRRWRAALKTYRAEAYNRFTFRNDTGIVSIVESLTDTYWDRKRGGREVVRSRRQTSNMDLEAFLPAALFVKNLYDDDVELSGYRMVGVTHPKALDTYRFRLEGTRMRDNRLVYDISVTPRSKLSSAFVGYVAVLDSVYALIAADLEPGEAFLFPPPIKSLRVVYHQQYSDFGKDFWLPVDFRADIRLKVSFSGLLAFPTFHIEQVSRLSDYRVNVPLPDSVYEEKRYVQVDTVAVASHTVLDASGTAVPLTQGEARAYEGIDSTMTLDKAYRPTGPLARFVKVDEEEDTGGNAGDGERRRAAGVTLDPAVWYDRVDGLHLALKGSKSLSRSLRISAFGGYKTGPAWWTYGGGAEFRFGPKRRAALEAAYQTGIDTRYESRLRSRLTNSFTLLLGSPDYFDYFGNERVSIAARYRLPWHRLRLGVIFRDERHFSVTRHADFTLINRDRTFRGNPAVEEGRLRSIGVEVALFDDPLPLPVTGEHSLRLAFEHSAPTVLGSAFDFRRFSLEANWRVQTFFRRRLLPNALDVRLTVLLHDGRLPPQRFGIVEAAGGVYKPFGVLRTLRDLPYEGDRVVGFFWEHNFRTVPFEVLGLRGLARRGYNLIVHGGHARSWVSGGDRGFEPRVPSGGHHELGLTLSGLFGLIRLDATMRLDRPGFSVGFGAARVF